MVFAGNFTRKVKGTASVMGPSMTASLEPLGKEGTSVHCKLSGLATEAAANWTADTLRPYVAHLCECFGPQRLMWGSDWPVVLLGGGYARWHAAAGAMLAELSSDERGAVFGDNARRFYALGAESAPRPG